MIPLNAEKRRKPRVYNPEQRNPRWMGAQARRAGLDYFDNPFLRIVEGDGFVETYSVWDGRARRWAAGWRQAA